MAQAYVLLNCELALKKK